MGKIMTNDKTSNSEAANDSHASETQEHDKPAAEKKPRDDKKFAGLSIDDTDDFGGDPYNHTGSFYVPTDRD